MRLVWVGIPLVVAVQLVAHGAQSQPAATPPAATPSQAITVTGCLQAKAAGSGSSPSNASRL